ncbi:GlxA family transcriptional regulator [Litoreibacter albidus]|uniref:Transcriptional regulator GlxA family, contains an amidase domain and an AraC-type DNA-binding HTH domain n=1 Tax=Litoreibacter albidus TaxID=670155 RepID=A0A1H2V6L9_9RHOB|nr:DJ-1/PfpI family protein [Litoreibacter albidus]SDW63549.1 Transcriptional regulator GlxA family, contains an amidase domain and an AraC-type DNA-binding HTH domain [Litoreibacter albidus]
MDTSQKTRSIDVLLFDDVNLLDVSGPVQAFNTARMNGQKRYSVRYVSFDGSPVRAGCGLRMTPDAALSPETTSDDLLIPGGAGVDALIPNSAVRDIVANHLDRKPNGRVISICSGALLLAAAGVLDGRAATTHWSRLADTKEYDRVSWDLDQILTAQDRVFTSAGVTTGIDLALSIIRADCGATVALAVARELVVQLRRTGGQSQYAIHLAGQFTKDDALTKLIEQVVAQPHLDWSLDALAQTAGMNRRTLSRHFKRDLQENPAQFVERIRVDHARGLMADKLPLKQVAQLSGFGDLQRMRRAFQRRFGIHVSDYMSSFVT